MHVFSHAGLPWVEGTLEPSPKCAHMGLPGRDQPQEVLPRVVCLPASEGITHQARACVVKLLQCG